ncbi:MAG: hypothetical protein K5917_03935, partial [Clostridiales bacterium]|nr:hypothetical protein [Clostridiales bacterium]
NSCKPKAPTVSMFFNGTGRGFQRGNTNSMRHRQVTPQIFDLVGGTYALAGFPLWRRSLAERSLSLVKENASRRHNKLKFHLSELSKIKRLVFDCRRGFHFLLVEEENETKEVKLRGTRLLRQKSGSP